MPSRRHTIITGHSGAGKTTLARSFGLPVHALDDDPDIRAQLEFQKQYREQNDGRLPIGGEHTVRMRAAEHAAIRRALALKAPHAIEGSYFLSTRPSAYRRHDLHLVDVDPELAVRQRVERQRVKDIARGKGWSDERAEGVAMRGRQLVDEYAPGVARWRKSKHVTKHTREHEKAAAVEYRGHTFPGYNQPIRASGDGQHKMMVLAKKGDDVRLVRFGHRGYRHNYSPEAKANYLKRSAGIRDGSGNLTKDDKFSANYWARKHLWPRNQEADGSALHKEASGENYRHRATILLRNKDGHILAAAKPAFTTIQFPGGGIHEDERFDMPTEAEILAGARREAREELGHDLANLRYIGALRNAMDERFRERQTLKRGVPIHGLHEHYVEARKGRSARKSHGSAGDRFRGHYMSLEDILWHMDKDARGISEGAEHAAREAALLRKHLLKQAALPMQLALPMAQVGARFRDTLLGVKRPGPQRAVSPLEMHPNGVPGAIYSPIDDAPGTTPTAAPVPRVIGRGGQPTLPGVLGFRVGQVTQNPWVQMFLDQTKDGGLFNK